jgi:hypothetical protein
MPEALHSPGKPVNGWTVDTLHEHLDSLVREGFARLETLIIEKDKQYDLRFEGIVTATQAALAAADRAVGKAEAAAEKRFEGVNEFRAALGDQQRMLMPRGETEMLVNGLNDKVIALTTAIGGLSGVRTGVGQGWAWALGAVALIASVVSIILAFAK